MTAHFDAIIIGGGPAGSSAAIGLSSAGMNVAVLEKKSFPREMLCGEFLSHEVTSALRSFGLYEEFLSLGPQRLTRFAFTPENGLTAEHPIGFEAWSLKRSLFDRLLLGGAKTAGATILQPAEVVSIERNDGQFEVQYMAGGSRFTASANTLIAAYGKQSGLDKELKRSFTQLRSLMSGVKYHVPLRFIDNLPEGHIRLFSTKGAYCGASCVSREEATLCALVDGQAFGGRPVHGLLTLWRRNREFRSLFSADLETTLRELHPYGIGNIFLGKKMVVENGIYMIGDAAGMIAPLAGDGIGMAIEGGALVARMLVSANKKGLAPAESETLYRQEWRRLFRGRISLASRLQRIAMGSLGGNVGAALMRTFPAVTAQVLNRTRGNSAGGNSRHHHLFVHN